MAIQTFTSVQGQSIFDVCLNTYGSLDFLYKLVNDNNFGSINTVPYGGQPFIFDTNFIVDQTISAGFKSTKLATLQNPPPVDPNNRDQGLALLSQKYATANISGSQNIVTVKNMYQNTSLDLYTATGGETSIPFAAWIGWTALYVTKDIKPLKPSEFGWNSSSGTLTLNAGLVMSPGEVIYVLFQKMVSS